MHIKAEIDPSETDVEATVKDTPSMVRILEVRFGRLVVSMDLHTWNLAVSEIRREIQRLNAAKCSCKFVGSGQGMDTRGCVVHPKNLYPCERKKCPNYRPVHAPTKRADGGINWPLCVCGEIAQEHN